MTAPRRTAAAARRHALVEALAVALETGHVEDRRGDGRDEAASPDVTFRFTLPRAASGP